MVETKTTQTEEAQIERIKKKERKVKRNIDRKLLESLCSHGVPVNVIASVFKVSTTEIRKYIKEKYNLDLQEYYEIRAKQKEGGHKRWGTKMFANKDYTPLEESSLRYLTSEERMQLERVKQKMTAKQIAFADYFLEIREKKEAAIKAGYTVIGSSSAAFSLFRKKWVAEYIRLRTLQRERAHGLDKTRYLRILDDIACNHEDADVRIRAIIVIGRWLQYEKPAATQENERQPIEIHVIKPEQTQEHTLQEQTQKTPPNQLLATSGQTPTTHQ